MRVSINLIAFNWIALEIRRTSKDKNNRRCPQVPKGYRVEQVFRNKQPLATAFSDKFCDEKAITLVDVRIEPSTFGQSSQTWQT